MMRRICQIFSSLREVDLYNNQLAGCTKMQKSLRHSRTSQLTSFLKDSQFQNILKHSRLQEITSVFLDNCGLETLPNPLSPLQAPPSC